MHRKPRVRWLASLGLLAAAASAQESPTPPPASPLPRVENLPTGIDLSGPTPILPGFEPILVLDPVAAERATNDRAYREYLHLREILIARGHLGRWIGIAGGELLPKDGESLAPEAELAPLLSILEFLHPGARHRYVFRIGEEGDVAYRFFAPNLPGSDALGVGLFHALGLAGNEGDVVFGPDRVYVNRGEKRHAFPYGDHGIPMQLADPFGGRELTATVTPSSACDGTIVLSQVTALALALERFEIPGSAYYGPDEHPLYQCRRARLRWRAPELDLDASISIAIWPDGPMDRSLPR